MSPTRDDVAGVLNTDQTADRDISTPYNEKNTDQSSSVQGVNAELIDAESSTASSQAASNTCQPLLTNCSSRAAQLQIVNSNSVVHRVGRISQPTANGGTSLSDPSNESNEKMDSSRGSRQTKPEVSKNLSDFIQNLHINLYIILGTCCLSCWQDKFNTTT